VTERFEIVLSWDRTDGSLCYRFR